MWNSENKHILSLVLHTIDINIVLFSDICIYVLQLLTFCKINAEWIKIELRKELIEW